MVSGLEDEVDAAQAAYDGAVAARNAIQTTITTTTNGQGNCVGNTTQRNNCEAAKLALPGAQSNVTATSGELAAAQADLAAALLLLLEELEGGVTEAFEDLQDAAKDVANADGIVTLAEEAVTAASGEVTAKQQIVDTALEAVAQATTGLGAADQDVTNATANLQEALAEQTAAALAVGQLEAGITAKELELAAARDAAAAAQAALEAYVPPVTVDRHPGCNGIENAVKQVTTKGNGKGKAAELLTAKAADWNCAA